MRTDIADCGLLRAYQRVVLIEDWNAAPLLLIMLLASCAYAEEGKPAPKPEAPKPVALTGTATPSGDAISPPPFSEGIFPCSSCHEDLTPNPVQRQLTKKHKDIVLHHDEKNRWCLDCHDTKDRDKLHLASGKLIDFTESYKLCGQCHGPQLRGWKAGEHGKRTGMWNGPKQYYLCVSCHSPHSPHFKPLQPFNPPIRPADIKFEEGTAP